MKGWQLQNSQIIVRDGKTFAGGQGGKGEFLEVEGVKEEVRREGVN